MQDKQLVLGTKPISRLIFSFGVPGIINEVILLSYSVVDTIVIGRALSDRGLAAMAAVFPAILLFISLAILISSGSSTQFAIELGRENYHTCKRIIGSTLTSIIIFSLTVTALSWLGTKPLLWLGGANSDIYQMAADYLHIYCAGFIFMALGFTLMSFMTACGHPLRSVFLHGTAAFINIILDIVFVLVCDWGIVGAASATMIAWAVSFLIGVAFFRSAQSPFIIKLTDLRLSIQHFSRSFKFGLPPFFMHLGNSITYSVTFMLVARYAESYYLTATEGLAIANIVYKSAQTILMMPMGLIIGCSVIFGYNYGAGRHDRVLELVKKLAFIGTLLIIPIYALCMIFTPQINSLFGLSPDLQLIGTKLLRLNICVIFLAVLEIVASAYLTGTGKYRSGSLVMSGRSILIILPVTVLLPRLLPNWLNISEFESLIIALPTTDVIMLLISIGLMIPQIRYLKQQARQTHNLHS